jgi:hypothetical protein
MTTLIQKFEQPYTGAVNRPINKKLEEWISVLDFGADPTGATDSTAAIQAAFDNSPQNAVIYFPNGTYHISSTITINSNNISSIIGESQFQTVILAVGFSTDVAMFSFAGTEVNPLQNIQIKNINLWSDNGQARGLTMTWVSLSTLENIYLYKLYNGIFCDYSFANSFKNVITYIINGQTVILNQQCNDIHFDRCGFTGVYGVHLQGGGANLKFTACDFEGTSGTNAAALYFAPVTGSTFVGITLDTCYFENTNGVAINFHGDDANSISAVVIKGCYINGSQANSNIAIGLENIRGFDISNNYFVNWNTCAIFRNATEFYGNVANNILVSVPALTQDSNGLAPNVNIINNTYGRQQLTRPSAPTTGTFSVGDIAWNSTPTAGGYVGWVCVTAGTPGTWKTFGAISA